MQYVGNTLCRVKLEASWNANCMDSFFFLAYLSWKLKWAFLITRCKLLHFRILLQNHRANFNHTWHKSSLGKGIQVCANEGDSPSSRGDNSKRVKIHWILKKKSSPEQASQIQSNLVQIILGWRELKFAQIKG
jgi:hypothetical protein